MAATDDRALARNLKKHLTDLTNSVMAYINNVDRVMREPESQERGKRVAALTNALEMANDKARYFGLGINWRKDQKRVCAECQGEGVISHSWGYISCGACHGKGH